MIVLPPLLAPKRHVITHHCIEITNSKSSTACSRCRARSRCRCWGCCRCRCRRRCKGRCGCRGKCRCRRGRECRGSRRRRGRRRYVALNKSGALVCSTAKRVIEHSRLIEVRHRIEVYTKGAGGSVRWVGLGGNNSVANKPCEVTRRIIDQAVKVFYHLEEFAWALGLTA